MEMEQIENNPLPEASRILRRFKQKNKEEFKYAAKDCKPPHGYKPFDEELEVYGLISTLSASLSLEDFFEMNFFETYVIPTTPIRQIEEFLDHLKNDIEILFGLKEKYLNQGEGEVPIPIQNTLKLHLDTKEVIEFVLNLSEIKEYRDNKNKGELGPLPADVEKLREVAKKARELLSQNKIEECIISLETCDGVPDLLGIRSRFSRLKEKDQKGLRKEEDLDVMENKIVDTLLQIIDKIGVG